MPSLGRRRSHGYTLVELVVALTLAGLLAGLAAPALGGQLRRLRMQATLDTLSRDIFYARMVAVRSATRVELRFAGSGEDCVEAYRIVAIGEPEREVKRVDVTALARRLCLRKNGPAAVTFSPRGRPNWNLSFWIHSDGMRDSLTLNQLGRVHRWP